MDWPTVQIIIVLILVAVVFFGFVRERMPPDLVAMSAVALLLVFGILSTEDVLGVFSNSAPATVGAMFVLSAALERTGVIDWVGRLVSGAASWSPSVALVAMMLSVMTLSAFINNTPVVVVLTPVVIALAAALKLSASKLLIPLSFASIFGGTTTLIGTSTNLLVDGVAQEQGLAPFGMFEITAAGLIMAAAGVAYMAVAGRWLLPDRETLASMLPKPADRKFLAEVLVPVGSGLIGRKLDEAGFGGGRGFHVVDVLRRDASLRWSLDDLQLEAGDRVVLRSSIGDVLALRKASDVAFGDGNHSDGRSRAVEPIGTRETMVMEGMVGPQSRFIGRRAGDLNLRRLYGAYVIAIHRQGESVGENFRTARLQMGDTILLEGPAEGMRRMFDRRDLINLLEPSEKPLRREKAPIAVLAMLLVMGLAAFEVLPIAALAMIAAVAVVGLGCLSTEEAYGAIRWNNLFLIFGMLALGTAMENTGAALMVAESFAQLAAALGPIAVLSAIYLITSLLTELMSNNAAAILLTPIAIGIAHALGVDPRPFAVAVMFAASASFATPIGYQTNTLVYSAGGYRFSDFLRIGLPLNLVMWIVATLVIPVFWPL